MREGGSTITQQLARGLFLGRERTLGRKLLEIVQRGRARAAAVEGPDPRDVPQLRLLGPGRGPRRRRRRRGGALVLRRAGRVARPRARPRCSRALIPAPNAYSPFRNPAARAPSSATRCSPTWSRPACSTRRPRRRARRRSTSSAARRAADRFPSFVDYVGTYLEAHVPEEARRALGPRDPHHLRPGVAARGRGRLAAGLDAFDPRRERRARREPLEGAFVAIEPAPAPCARSSAAAVPREGDFNRATQAQRQSGSAIKPIVYAAALDAAARRRGVDRRLDRARPAAHVRQRRKTWTPGNSDGEYHGSHHARARARQVAEPGDANLVEAIGADVIVLRRALRARQAQAGALDRARHERGRRCST